jgi:mono/diheme cytochrome c family protein
MARISVRIRASTFTLILLGGCLPVRGEAAQPPQSGRDLYLTACAACHGPDGKGMPRSIVGFDTPLPDLTQCSFATPEADADWFAVAHSGGAVRAFDRRMPAFGEALTSEQIASVIGHIRTFCTDKGWPRGELNLPRALRTEKAFPENEALLTVSAAGSDVTTSMIYERRLGARSQFEAVVPLAFSEGDPSTGSGQGWNKGVGDIALAGKHVLYHSLDRGSILSAAAEVIFPTGDEDEGLGSGVTKVEPYLAFGQLLPRDSFLQFQGGMEISTDRSRAAHEAFWRAAFGRTLFEPNFGRAWTPMLELVAVREFEDDATVLWDVVPQLQLSLSRRQHVLFNLGVQIPVNARQDRKTAFLTYLLWDWFDGGFLSGWR